jgi:hypothetical protein
MILGEILKAPEQGQERHADFIGFIGMTEVAPWYKAFKNGV